jgi:hypothetical protein
MIGKVGKVSNPLTIVAIFATIAEVSGSAALPFLREPSQVIYVWFLMFFPGALLVFFFLTLNFNRHVLYAPSDFKDELNYFKFSFQESKAITRVAEAGKPISKRQVGRVSITKDESLQQVIVAKHDEERYTFLSHEVVPFEKNPKEYDVILYIAGHFNNLEQVSMVEYFLGEGWGDAIFASKDRGRNFAIKVSALGAFLAMARIHFTEGTTLTQSRFVDLDPLN